MSLPPKKASTKTAPKTNIGAIKTKTKVAVNAKKPADKTQTKTSVGPTLRQAPQKQGGNPAIIIALVLSLLAMVGGGAFFLLGNGGGAKTLAEVEAARAKEAEEKKLPEAELLDYIPYKCNSLLGGDVEGLQKIIKDNPSILPEGMKALLNSEIGPNNWLKFLAAQSHRPGAKIESLFVFQAKESVDLEAISAQLKASKYLTAFELLKSKSGIDFYKLTTPFGTRFLTCLDEEKQVYAMGTAVFQSSCKLAKEKETTVKSVNTNKALMASSYHGKKRGLMWRADHDPSYGDLPPVNSMTNRLTVFKSGNLKLEGVLVPKDLDGNITFLFKLKQNLSKMGPIEDTMKVKVDNKVNGIKLSSSFSKKAVGELFKKKAFFPFDFLVLRHTAGK